jgi:hypothetical protein
MYAIYVHVCYSDCMPVTITKFRKEIFELAAQALEGKEVSFIHKGKLLKLVPEEETVHWFDRMTPLDLINEDWVEPAISLQEEMETEWESDWADL